MPKKPIGKTPRRGRRRKPVARNKAPRRRVGWYVRNAENLRFTGKEVLTQAALGAKAKVGRDAVSKIERSIPVTRMIAGRVFGALNDLHGEKLTARSYVTKKPPRKSAH
jgi:hypothetical protein